LPPEGVPLGPLGCRQEDHPYPDGLLALILVLVLLVVGAHLLVDDHDLRLDFTADEALAQELVLDLLPVGIQTGTVPFEDLDKLVQLHFFRGQHPRMTFMASSSFTVRPDCLDCCSMSLLSIMRLRMAVLPSAMTLSLSPPR
jgi:hypothetical protein